MIVNTMDLAPGRHEAVQLETVIEAEVTQAVCLDPIECQILKCLHHREAVSLRDLLQALKAPFEQVLNCLETMELSGAIESIKPIGFESTGLKPNAPGFLSSIFFRELRDETYPRQFKAPPLRCIHLSKCPQLAAD